MPNSREGQRHVILLVACGVTNAVQPCAALQFFVELLIGDALTTSTFWGRDPSTRNRRFPAFYPDVSTTRSDRWPLSLCAPRLPCDQATATIQQLSICDNPSNHPFDPNRISSATALYRSKMPSMWLTDMQSMRELPDGW